MIDQTVGYKAKAFEPRNLLLFFLIAFGLTWFKSALLIAGILKTPTGIQDPGFPLYLVVDLVCGSGPLIGAFVMTGITEGKPGVRALWKRFWSLNFSFKWLLITLLILPTLEFIANLVTRMLDGQAYPFLDIPDQPWMVFVWFLQAFLFNGMAEEFGWRGYALPRFQAKWNALTSSLILGAIWASWHIPSFFVPGHPLGHKNFWLWAFGTILLAIMMTWIFNNTHGSVLTACLFHAMVNTGIVWFQLDWRYYAIELIAVILIVIIYGPKDLVRERPEKGVYAVNAAAKA